jgi:uncharacterized membrane protein
MKLASDFRASAREALKGKWGLAIITGIIASILGVGSNGSSFVPEFSTGTSTEGITIENFDIEAFLENPSIEALFPGVDATFWAIMGVVLAVALVVGFVVGIAMFILGSIVSVGYAKFYLNIIDGADAQINDLFKYFKFWKTTILANLLRSLYIFLWSLLCFIPGIIAAYSYVMVPYIMAENPELTAREACERSKQMMDGNRMRLFCLTFSFIGWMFLCTLTCGIGNFVLNPYIEASIADFYREISDTRRIPEPDDTIPVYIPESQH